MKLIAVIIGVFTITSAIRVPTSWPKKQSIQQTRHKSRPVPLAERSEIRIRPQPHVAPKYNKINIERKYQPYNAIRHPNPKNQEPIHDFKASSSNNDWRPVFPAFITSADNAFFRDFKSPLHKNYRDDKTHEPEIEIIREKHIHKETPLSSHEVPPDVPTRPIYPGEGQWAKRGKIQRPYKHKFAIVEDEASEEDKPDGFEVFEKNQKLFDKKQGEFKGKLQEIPEKHKLGAFTEASDDNEEAEEDDSRQQFVPTKLYAQVRRSENVEQHPRLAEDPRLREVIKDSKIQTVYTEEGYEDIAYDHAGHEKNAEESEGFAEFDKEIEKEKQKQAQKQIEDDDEEDSQTAGSQHHVIDKPHKMKKGNLMKTEETKTTSLKNKGNGNSELEIKSEVKILETPNNGKKAHRYVKIFPKVYRYDIVTTPSPSSTKVPDLAPMESVLVRRRFKRFTNDFPEIKVDTDFIDKIKHDIPQKAQKFEKPKYPYYNDPSIHPDSPLRYAEDMDNIPKKTEDDLAFYHQADKIECPQVEDSVDPIPARVKNADADPENVEDATDVQELVPTPRLKNLGDKIDCFKLKYFGENPLDSPFFKEEIIGPVTPLFNIYKLNAREKIFNLQELSKKPVNTNQIVQDHEPKSTSSSEQADHLGFNILTDVISQFNKSKDIQAAASEIGSGNGTRTEDNQVEKNGETQTETPVISIITTPKYTIDLKPKHIYHQIELLEYLPNKSSNVSENSNSTNVPPNHREAKSMDEEAATPTPTEELPPESQALRKLRRRPRPRLPYYVFDVNKFLPTRPYSPLNHYKTSTMVPQHDSSEIHYKIKPSEQLTVFADVINNIKNSSKDPFQLAASSDRVAVKLNLFNKYHKIPHIKNLDNIEETNSFYLTTSTTTTLPPRGNVKFSTSKNKDFYDDDTVKYENLELLKVNRKRTTTTTTTEPDYSDNKSSASNAEAEDEEEESVSEVLGLIPPGMGRYKTIYNTKPLKHYEVIEETKINQFYVVGMKPPSLKQKTYIYSDFKIHPSVKKYSYLRRGKRSAQRPAYSEVVRNRNKPIDVQDDAEVVVEEDDDDYVPHRPRNYHYDEKTGRIVYDTVKKEEEEPEEEYVEVTEAPLPKPTRRNVVTTPKFKPYTGPSYIEFVNKLKTDPNYQAIPDPTTTEKSEDEATTTTTTPKPASTNPPEFLNILSKVRSSSNYKPIQDKTTTKASKTTEAPAAEEEEEQETQLENVKNSPGGQSSGQNFQIFDISEYLPKVRNYSPRTSIDYSKYKTIERPSSVPRHNLSSRYNSEDEALEDVKTSKAPVLLEEKKNEPIEAEINPIVSESKHEDVEPSTTTTTETTTTRRIRSRPKSRGTRRPTQRNPTTIRTPVSVTETEPSPVQHDKPRRTFPRRRPTRIKINKPTTASDSEVEETTTKIVRRRHQMVTAAPVEPQIEERIDATASEKKPRIVSPNEVNNTKPGNIQPRKIEHVQVFQQYDESKKHGGNYKGDNDSKETKKVHEVKRLTDVVPKPSAFYNDPKLPKKVNQLKEVEVVEEELEESKDEEGSDIGEEFDYEGEEEKTTTTKKPLIIKDPGKRLYYYAPV